MSGGKIDIKDLPLCTDSDLHRYRVIGWKARSGNINSDVVPGDYIAGKGEYSPSSIYSKVIQEYYGPFHACRLGNASYLVFEKPLSFGGNEKPYTNVPLCEKGQSLRRALLRPGQDDPDCQDRPNLQKCLPMGTDRHEMALIPFGRFDPRDHQIESLKKFLSATNAKDLCQKKNPDDKWALYWIDYEYRDSDSFAEKVWTELEKIELKADFESRKKIVRRIVDEMPEAWRRCQPSEAEQNQLMAQELKLLDEQKTFYEALEDPSISSGVVPGLAELLLAEVKFYDLSGDGRRVLENVLSLGLRHGISEQFMLSAAVDLTLHTSDEQAFLCGLMTMVMLKVAKRLHELSLAEGRPGISPEFGDFVTAVEGAIRSGRISFRVQSVAELLYFSAPAQYNGLENEIIFPPLSSAYPLEIFMDAIVHESFHAYQDMQAKPLTVFESELQAYEGGLRASVLLDVLFLKRAVSAQCIFETGKMERGIKHRADKCFGADDEMINRSDAFADEAGLFLSEWQMEATLNVLGYPSKSSAETFRRAYRFINLDSLMTTGNAQWMIRVGRLIDMIKMANNEEMLDDLRMQMQTIEKQLSKARFIFGWPPGTPEQAEAAYFYLSLFCALNAYAYHLDRNRWEELHAQFYEEADFLGESLLYLIGFEDGI